MVDYSVVQTGWWGCKTAVQWVGLRADRRGCLVSHSAVLKVVSMGVRKGRRMALGWAVHWAYWKDDHWAIHSALRKVVH